MAKKEIKTIKSVIEHWPLGIIVYLKHDQEQIPRMITGFTVREKEVQYHLITGDLVDMHYDYEFSLEKDPMY